MNPPPLTPQPERHDLPRLAAEFYRAFAVVHWTITLERRASGWLDDSFHQHFRELLLHAAAREGLFCPAYVLMPDHMHLIWMGLHVSSDQRNAMKFLRKHLAVELKRRSRANAEFELQKQSHDSVLREKDRVRGAFAKACFYVLDNPRRKELVKHCTMKRATTRYGIVRASVHCPEFKGRPTYSRQTAWRDEAWPRSSSRPQSRQAMNNSAQAPGSWVRFGRRGSAALPQPGRAELPLYPN